MSEILFADDDAAMRDMVGDVLRAAGHQVQLAADGKSALAAVRRSTPDLIVLDYRMPAPDGLEVCRSLKADPRTSYVPVLILTAENAVDDRIQGFDSGADEYLAKPFDARELTARVRALLRLTRQGLDRNPTSGLPGGDAIPREFERRKQLGQPFTVTYLDLDYFKPFGDRFGFAIADEVIRGVGRILPEVTSGSFVGHVGGDDFILFTAPESARPQVEEIRERLRGVLAANLPADAVASGKYRSKDREGVEREFALTRFAAAIVHVRPEQLGTLEELGEAVAAYKRLAKQEESGTVELELPGKPVVAAPEG